MKFNLVPTVIAVAISGLCAYAFYNWCAEPENILVAIFGGITMCCTLSTALGCVFQRERTSANIKLLNIHRNLSDKAQKKTAQKDGPIEFEFGQITSR